MSNSLKHVWALAIVLVAIATASAVVVPENDKTLVVENLKVTGSFQVTNDKYALSISPKDDGVYIHMNAIGKEGEHLTVYVNEKDGMVIAMGKPEKGYNFAVVRDPQGKAAFAVEDFIVRSATKEE